MKKYDLYCDEEVILKDATKEKVIKWLISDITDIMCNNHDTRDEGYLEQMVAWSKEIIAINDANFENEKDYIYTYLWGRGFSLKPVANEVYEIHLSNDNWNWSMIGNYKDIKVARELKKILLRDEFGIKYVEIWDKNKGECVEYTDEGEN